MVNIVAVIPVKVGGLWYARRDSAYPMSILLCYNAMCGYDSTYVFYGKRTN